MREIEVGGHVYQIGRLNIFQQAVVAKPLVPIMASLVRAGGMTGSIADVLDAIGGALQNIPDEDCHKVLTTCLGAVTRKAGSSYASVIVSGRMMFEDISLPDALQLARAVIEDNLGGFFPAPPST